MKVECYCGTIFDADPRGDVCPNCRAPHAAVDPPPPRPLTKREVAQVLKAGDVIADCLGFATAAVEAGDKWTPQQFEGARRAIAYWHRVRASAGK